MKQLCYAMIFWRMKTFCPTFIHRSTNQHLHVVHASGIIFFFYPRISFLLKNFFFPAPSVGNVQSAIETIYPLVKEFSKQRTKEELMEIKRFHMKRSIDGWESDRSNESEEDK